MKNMTLAQKVKELRISSGSSQEDLAERTQLSPRTIQRIENGETQPRGDSLKRLAAALGVATEELTGLMDMIESMDAGEPGADGKGVPDEQFREQGSIQRVERSRIMERFQEPGENQSADRLQTADPLPEDKGFLIVLHLSALGFILFPGYLLLPAMGILAPLTLWLLKKDKIRGVRETGKKILNFQLSWFLVFAIIFGNTAITKILHVEAFPDHVTTLRILIALYLFNVVTIIVNIVRVGKDRTIVYRPAIPFMPQ